MLRFFFFNVYEVVGDSSDFFGELSVQGSLPPLKLDYFLVVELSFVYILDINSLGWLAKFFPILWAVPSILLFPFAVRKFLIDAISFVYFCFCFLGKL